MPEAVEPSTPPETPPVVPEKKPTAGDKFRAEFAKLEKLEKEQPALPPTGAEGTGTIQSEPDKPTVAKQAPAPEPSKPPADKPASPLDVLLEKPPEKKEEAPQELPEKIEDLDQKSRAVNWERARTSIKTQSAKITELEAELVKARTVQAPDTAAIAKERDELKAKIAEQEKNLKAINAEYSDEYQGLLKDRGNVLQKIGSRAKSFGADSDTLLGALALPDSRFKSQQIKEALGELDPDDKARIHTLIEQLETHDEKIDDYRKDLPGKFDQLQAKRDAQIREQEIENLKSIETNFGRVVDELPKQTVSLREVPDDIPGAAEWNAEIRGARETALSALRPNGTDFNQTVALAVKGARYDSLEKRYLQLHSDYTDAMKRLREFDQSGPDFTGGKKQTVEPKLKPGEKYRRAMAAQAAVEE